MIVNEPAASNDCRFWYMALPYSLKGQARRDAMATLKARGFKATQYGLKSRRAAASRADVIERTTGIEMEIGKHDYL